MSHVEEMRAGKSHLFGESGIVPEIFGSEDVLSEDGESPREACGVFGIYAPGRPVAYMTYDGIFALQHRGQESAGMAVSDGDSVTVVRDMGLVSNVFDERTLKPLVGDLAIGHVRYS